MSIVVLCSRVRDTPQWAGSSAARWPFWFGAEMRHAALICPPGTRPWETVGIFEF